MKTIERKSYAKRVLAMILLVLMAFNVVGDTALAAASAAASFQGDATGRNVRYSSRIPAPYRAEAVATAAPVPAVTEIPAAETQATSAPVQESVSAEETAVPQEETAAPVETAVPEVTAAPQETAAPSATPDTRTALHKAIAKSGYAYVRTNQGNLNVYGGPSMILGTHKGHLVYGDALVYAIGYTQRDGQEAAVAIRFATRDGLVEGYVAESQLRGDVLSPETVRASLAAEISAGEIQHWMDGDKSARPLPVVAYRVKEVTPEETAEPAQEEEAASQETPAVDETEATPAPEASDAPEAAEDTAAPALVATETTVPTQAPEVATSTNLVDPDYTWTLTDDATGVSVGLTGAALPEGVQPEDVALTVRALTQAEIEQYTAGLTKDERDLFVAYDITLLSTVTGQAFQPLKPVQVQLPVPAAADAMEEPELTVFHMEEGGTAEVVHQEISEGDTTLFDADSFSVYLLRLTPKAPGVDLDQKLNMKVTFNVDPADAAIEAALRPDYVSYKVLSKTGVYTWGYPVYKNKNFEAETNWYLRDTSGVVQYFRWEPAWGSFAGQMYTSNPTFENGVLKDTLTFRKTTPYTVRVKFNDQDNAFNTRPATLDASTTTLEYAGQRYAADSVVKEDDGTFVVKWNSLPTFYRDGAGNYKPIPYHNALLSNPAIKTTLYTGTNNFDHVQDGYTKTFNLGYREFQVSHSIGVARYTSIYSGADDWKRVEDAGIQVPQSFTYTLMKNNAPVAGVAPYTVARNADGTFPDLNYIFKLPARDNTGAVIDYTGYSVKITPTTEDGTLDKRFMQTISAVGQPPNYYNVRTIATSIYPTNEMVSIKWDDDNNKLGLRTDSVKATILANGIPVPGIQSVDVPVVDGKLALYSLQYRSFLPQLDEHGNYIRYSFRLDGLPATYTATEVDEAPNDYDTTNGYAPGTAPAYYASFKKTITLKLASTKKIKANKVWDANGSGNEILSRPDGINVKILGSSDNGANWAPIEGRANQPIVPKNDVWTAEWDVPATDPQGRPLIYKLEETKLGVYDTTITQTAAGTEPQVFTITNTFQPNWDYALAMYWDDADPAKRIYQELATTSYNEVTQKANLSISTNKDYPAGSMVVRVPYVLHKQRRGGSYYPVPDVALPMAPATNPNYSFNYIIDKHGSNNPEDWELVFTNWQDVAAGYKLSTMIAWKYYPGYVYDWDEADLKATGTATAQGETSSTNRESNVITHKLDTGLSCPNFQFNKKAPAYGVASNTAGRLYVWDPFYGQKPDNFDPTQNNYVVYLINFDNTMYYNQPYRFILKDTPGQNGRIVAVNTRTSSYNFTYDAAKGAYVSSVIGGTSYGGNTYFSEVAYVVVAYPRSESLDAQGRVKDGVVYTNNAELSVIAADEHPGDKRPTDQFEVLKNTAGHSVPWEEYKYVYNGQIYSLSKYLSSSQNAHMTSLELGGKPSDYYSFSGIVTGYGLDNGFRFETFDDTVYVNPYNSVKGRYYGYERLDAADFEISGIKGYTSFTVNLGSNNVDKTTGLSIDGTVPAGAWKIMARKGNNAPWEEIYSFTMTSRSHSEQVPTETINGKGYTGLKLVSPEGLVGRFNFSFGNLNLNYKSTSPVLRPYIQNKDVSFITVANFAGLKVYQADNQGTYTWIDSNQQNSFMDNIGLTDLDQTEHGGRVFRTLDTRTMNRVQYSKYTYKGAVNTAYDVNNSKVDVTFVLVGREQMNTSDMEPEVYEAWAADSGILYDLLPTGYAIDRTKDIQVYGATAYTYSTYSEKTAALERLEVIDDYKGTGRQLVKFYVTSTQPPRKNYLQNGSSGTSTGFYVRFTATTSYSDVALFGNKGTNLMAYQRGDNREIPDGVADDGTSGGYSYFRDLKLPDGSQVLSDLNGNGNTEEKNTITAVENFTVSPITSVQTGIKKSVKAMSSYFRVDDVSDLGEDYTYRLLIETGDNGTTKNLVITDILENAQGANGWKGTFKSVNMTSARAAGIDAKVYYSTASNLTYTNASQMSLTAPHWSLTKPADNRAITAIAIDLRKKTDGSDMEFVDSNSVYVDVTMTAPATLQVHEKAHNQPAYWSTFKANASAVPTTSYNVGPVATVALHDLQDFTFLKQMRNNDDTAKLKLPGVGFWVYRSLTDPATGNPGDSSSSFGSTPVYQVTTDLNGRISLKNLDTGVYAIMETSVPLGVQLMNYRYWEFKVDGAAGTISNPVAKSTSTSSAYPPVPMTKETVNGQQEWTLVNNREIRALNVYKNWQDGNNRWSRVPITFELLRNGVKVDTKVLQPTSNATTFSNMLVYDLDGTKFNYEVRELPVPGYSNTDGPLNGTNTSAVSFTNSRLGTLQVTKVLQNSDATTGFPMELTLGGTDALETKYTLYRYESIGATDFTTEEVTVETGRKLKFRVKAGEMIRFIGLPVNVSYSVTESVGQYVTTIQNGTGTLTSTSTPQVVVTNATKPATFELPVKKVITGMARPAGDKKTFTFTLVRATGNDPMPSPATVTITDEGTAKIAPITFTKPGEYTYTMKETNNGHAGYTYDGSTHTIKVTVTDDNGQLKATWKDGTESPSHVTFTNDFSAKPADLVFPVKKILTGGTPPAAQTFTFTLVPVGNAPVPVNDTATINGAGTANFGKVTFTEAGVFGYTVKETQGTAAGYTYDNSTKTIRVSVTNVAGNLTPVWTVNGAQVTEITFTNNYVPAPTSVTIPVRKVVNGETTPVSKVFTFKLARVTAGAPMPANDTVTITGAGNASFGAMAYTTPGEYSYTLTETDGAQPGYTYDTAVRNLKVKVVDQGGSLAATWTVNDAAQTPVTFTNTYDPADATLTIPVRKTITGNARPAEKQFTFELKAQTAGAPMPANATLKVTGAATGNFGAITFTKAGTYKYELKETDSGEHGYTYDPAAHVIEAVVTDNNGTLSVVWKDNNTAVTDVNFTNNYTPDPVSVTIPVRKTITGNERPAQKETFRFKLVPTGGAPALATDTITITDEGNASFGALQFTAAGEYTYTLTEVGGTATGYTYDTTPRTVKVKVTDTNGVLSAAWTVNDQTVTPVVFTNKYEPSAVNLTLPLRKSITGNPRPAGERRTFTFTLSAAAGVPMPANATATITDEGNASLGAIAYTKAGTYTYTLKETQGSDPGYTYDSTPRTVVVTVTDTAGVLAVSYKVDGQAASTINFTNRYKPTDVALELPVKKNITGNPRPAGQKETFTFTLAAVTAGAPMPAQATVTITDAGTVKFPAMTYSAAGVYEYTLKETQGNKPGYTYDNTTHNIKVTVTDTNGVLSATWTDNNNTVADATFTNNYSPSVATVTLPVKKVITGNDRPTQKETFTFTLAAVTTGAPMPNPATVTITDAGNATFQAISFPVAGVYEYTLKETVGNKPGYTYDGTTRNIKVTVTDNNGTLSAAWTLDGQAATDVTFTNNYDPTDAVLALPVKKVITGNPRPAGEEETFSFKLEAAAGVPMPAADTVTITDAGAVSFGNITYTKAGEYTYTLKEIQGNKPGYTYDGTAHTIKVTVTDTNGVLSAVWTDNNNTVTDATFTNRYAPAAATLTIPVKKVLTGNATPANKTFTFTLAAVTPGAPVPAATTITVTGAGTESFGTITFTQAGTYTYTVKETQGTEPGYTYDNTTHTVVATVTDTAGVLSVTWKDNGQPGADVTFTNKYVPSPVTVAVPVQKLITGNPRPAQKETFTFTLAAVGTAPMPATDTVTITDAGNATFPAINFTAAGVYEYTLKETQGTAGGYTYDPATRNVKVTITDTNGTLSAVWTVNGAAENPVKFSNHYNPEEARLVIPVKKVITGNERPTQKETFTFTLAAVGTAPMPANATVTITDEGEVSFPAINYPAAGVYKYTLKETQGSKPGYTYDSVTHHLEVTVTDTAGVLSLTWTDNTNPGNKVTFTNNYTPAPVNLAVPVKKVMTGNERPAQKETFTFTLTAVGAAPMPANPTVTITDAGNATFGNISFTKAGEYTYTLKETQGTAQGYTYDGSTHTLKAVVTDVNGALQVEWKDNNATVTEVTFTNDYEPNAITLVLPVKKVITGNDRPAQKETFTFTLAAVGTAPMPVNPTVTITDAGEATFQAIKFPAAGVYKYTVKETQGSKPGYTYDGATHNITATVTDTQGVLSVAWTDNGAAGNKITFTNNYDPADATLALPVKKVITGNDRPAAKETFSFKLVPVAGAPMPANDTVTITDAGDATFGAITFPAAGVYEYTLAEVAGTKPGYTYDGTTHRIKVTVTDTNGVLSAAWTDNDATAANVTFTNDYDPADVTVALPVRKAINGNPRPAGEEETFTFTLVPESGAPASANATVTITDQGAATFGNITFTKTGEYTYTVKETAGSKPGYTYDATVHTVKITVTDVNGVLRAEWKDNNATVTNILFTNKYEPAPAAVTFPVKKVITGNDRPATKTFTFTLAAVTAGAPMPAAATVTVTDAGNASFPAIAFPAAGVYEYTLTENPGLEPGYTYDNAAHTLKVTVTDTAGVLSATWTDNGQPGAQVTFTNVYDPADATVTIPVQKLITGNNRPAQKETFRFVLTPQGGAPAPATTAVTIEDVGTASFPAITFTKAGTYTYSLAETQGSAGGYTYDTAPRTVKVTVTDTNGTLNAVWTVNDATENPVKFTNNYAPDVAGIDVPIRKAITGNVRPAQKETFTFTLAAVGGAPLPADTVKTIEDEGTASFGRFTFNTAGEYNYTITETQGAANGYTYDTAVRNIKITVTDTAGVLSASFTSNGATVPSVVFTNNYDPADATLVVPVEKKITGNARPAQKETFSFTMAAVTPGAPMPANTTVTVTDEGNASFPAITFTAAGVYEYTLKETQGSKPGYTYDGTVHNLKVTVTDTNGVLSAVWTDNGQTVTRSLFTNNYTPAPVTAAVPVEKLIIGNPRPAGEQETFTFEITAVAGAPMPAANTVTITDVGTAAFGAISYTAAGTYRYTVKERAGTKSAYTYANTVANVEVTVTDVNGALTSSWEADGVAGGKATFTNRYTPAPAGLKLPVTKAITGNDRPAQKETFRFKLVPQAGAPMPASDTVTITDAGDALFGEITFPAAGVYTYTLSEVAGSKPGYTYDNATHTIKVTVTDTQGVLSIAWTSDDAAATSVVFTNNYTPAPTSLVLPVRKAITGNPRPAGNLETFTFTLEAQAGAPMPAGATVSITDAGNASFPAISFTKAGTYTYTLRENAGNKPGYGYDDTLHTIVATVTDVNGALNVTWTDNGAAGGNVTFTNTYDPQKATVNFPVKKVVTGNDRPAQKTFSFKLVPVAGAPMPASDTVTITDAGEASFATITFPAAGVYDYTLAEVAGTEPGYTYDNTNHALKVTVSDVNGVLTAAWTDNGTAGDKVTFTNNYTPAPTTLTLPVIKTMTGNARPAGQEETFTFTIAPQNGAPAPATTSVTITDQGNAAFPAITFTKAGTYTYKVAETEGTKPGYTYDTPVRTVTVTVTDTNGVLSQTWSVDMGVQTAVAFTNNYDPAKAQVIFPVRKTITGNPRPAQKETFNFVLAAVTPGAPMPAVTAVTITDQGTANFPVINFGTAGTYDYTLKETAGTAAGYTYDGTVHNLRVVVTDVNGVLTPTWTDNGNQVADVNFTNDYTPTPATFNIPAQKVIRYVTPSAASNFTFTVTGEAGAPMPAIPALTVTGATQGFFDTITFTQAGTYRYTVQEMPQALTGYTFDTHLYQVEITVTDVGGALATAWTVDGQTATTVTITNHYNPLPVWAQLPVTKVLTGQAPPSNATFTFNMAAMTPGAPLPASAEATITGAGNGMFLPMQFTQTGSYTYLITEVNNGVLGYTYDTTQYFATITVADVAGQLAFTVFYSTTTGTPVTEMKFTNRYDPVPASVEIPMRKTMVGDPRPMPQETFHFTLTPANPANPMPVSGNHSLVDQGTHRFGAMYFTAPGVYTYTLAETPGAAPGYTYDTVAHTITVTVWDDAGSLRAIWTDNGQPGTEVTFTNIYRPNPVSLQLPVTKMIQGTARPVLKPFTFMITGLNGAPMPASNLLTVMDAASGLLDTITFEHAGVYTYEVTEIQGAEHGYAYDATKHVITVTVVDVGAQLQATWTDNGAPGTSITFTNVYDPDAATLALPVRKTISGGHATPVDKTFHFTLTGLAGAPMPNGAVGNEADLAIVGANASAFPLIVYRQAGTYHYTLKEVHGSDRGYTYSNQVYHLTVDVTDVNGVLTATWREAAGATDLVFDNPYVPAPTSAVIPVLKGIWGTVPAGRETTFHFDLVPQGGAPAPAAGLDTVAINGQGVGYFGVINYTHAGDYTYVVAERDGGVKGYIYDTKPRIVTMHVRDVDGQLTPSYTVEVDGKIVEDMSIVNEYKAIPAVISITGQKVLRHKMLRAGQFRFNLYDELGRRVKTTLNTFSGVYTFTDIVFDRPGEFVYTVREFQGAEEGIRYDKSEFKITIRVVDVDGQLVATTDKHEGDLRFVNRFRSRVPKTGYDELLPYYPYFLGGAALLLLAFLLKKRKPAAR